MSDLKKSREQLLAELRSIRRRMDPPPPPRPHAGSRRLVLEDRPPLKFVLGIDDSTYFHWQVPIFCESLLGRLPEGWEILVVVCNDHRPISKTLRRIFEAYGVRHFTGASHADHQDLDFSAGGEIYRPLNKIEALNVAAGRIEDDDLVCLMDADNFLYRELDPSIFPRRDAVCSNWIIAEEAFLRHRSEPGEIDLQKILESIGCQEEFQPGGVAVFVSGRTLRNEKFVRDCFRFTQVVYLLGRIAGRESVWWAEMPCYTLALAANSIPADLIDDESFVIDKRESIAPGSFYHYYADIKDSGVDGAFYHSKWGKQQFFHSDFLQSDLDASLSRAVTDHERYFFELAKRAAERLGRRPA